MKEDKIRKEVRKKEKVEREKTTTCGSENGKEESEEGTTPGE